MIKPTILVLDEDKGTRDAIRILLELNAINLVAPVELKSVDLLIAKTPYDLIICNIQLPNDLGIAILNKVKSSPLHFATPFIFIGDQLSTYSFRAALDLGADDYIQKPFSGKILAGIIKNKLEKSKRFLQLQQNEINEKTFNLLNRNFNQEILTPINAIHNVSTLLSDIGEEYNIDSMGDLLNIIHAASHRMLRATKNLLTYALLQNESEHNKIPLQPNIDLKKVMDKVVHKYESGRTPNSSAIDTSILQVGVLEGNEGIMELLFTELVDNAVRYSAEKEKPIVFLKALNDSFKCSVSNYVAHPVLFEVHQIAPFKKFHKDISRNGLGLGLYVCVSICNQLGYQFSMERQGNLITFTIEKE